MSGYVKFFILTFKKYFFYVMYVSKIYKIAI